jgi:hypothetical protein
MFKMSKINYLWVLEDLTGSPPTHLVPTWHQLQAYRPEQTLAACNPSLDKLGNETKQVINLEHSFCFERFESALRSPQATVHPVPPRFEIEVFVFFGY